MDMSNRSLALLLVAAIVISLGGTLISLNKLNQYGTTGLAVGQVNLSLGNLTACNVDKSVNFGSGNPIGTVNLSTDTDQSTYGFTSCATAGTNCGDGIQINNTGNVRLNVSFSSGYNASVFLGDSTSALAGFEYIVKNGTYKTGSAKSCTTGTLGTSTTYSAITQLVNYSVCSNMTPDMGADILSLGFYLIINETTPKTGTIYDNITIYCAQS